MLNEEQQNYYNQINYIVESNIEEGDFETPHILVTGKAGSGKSYLISALVKYFTDNTNKLKRKSQCTALTHKALNELRKKLKENDVNEDDLNGVSTLHSYFGIKAQINYKTGEEEFKVDRFKKPKKCGILFIDEVSMMDDVLWKIVKSQRHLYSAIILCGDEFQVPPVNDSDYNIFNDSSIKKFKLNNIVRQAADNPIIKLASEIVQKIETKDFKNKSFCLKRIDDYSKIHTEINYTHDSSEFIRWYYDIVKEDAGKPIFESKFYTSLITTFTNKTVNSFNYIAKSIYRSTNKINFIDEGDVVVLQDPGFDPYIPDSIIFQNNSEILVQRLEEDTYEGIPIYIIHTDETFLRVAKPEGEELLNSKLSKLANNAKLNGKLWRNYYDFKKKFVSIKQVFACTTHKAQGSTVENVFVDLRDMPWVQDTELAFRLCYVAITRCSSMCFCKN